MGLIMVTVFMALGFLMLVFSIATSSNSYTIDKLIGVKMCKYTCLARNHCAAVRYSQTNLICEIFTNADIIKNQEKSPNIFTRTQLKAMKFQGDAKACGAVHCKEQGVCIASHNRCLVCVDPTQIKKHSGRKLRRPQIGFSMQVNNQSFVFKSMSFFDLVHTSGDVKNEASYYWTIHIELDPADDKKKASHFQMGHQNRSATDGFTFHFENDFDSKRSRWDLRENIKVTLFKFHTGVKVREYNLRRQRISLGFFVDMKSGQFLVVNPVEDEVLNSVQVETSADIYFTWELPVSSVATCILLTGETRSNRPPESLLKRTDLTFP